MQLQHFESKMTSADKLAPRTESIKQMLDLARQQNEEVLICILDKKTDKIVQYSSDVKKFNLKAASKMMKKQTQESKGVNIGDISDSESHNVWSSQSESTHETKKLSESETPKLSAGFFDICSDANHTTSGFEFKNFDLIHSKFEDSRFSFNMPKIATIFPAGEIGHDSTEPLAPTKNILFPIQN